MLFVIVLISFAIGEIIHADPLPDTNDIFGFVDLKEPNHRVRRATELFVGKNISYSCNTSSLPQPTAEFPVVLFKDVNYNNCSSGEFMRVRAGVFEKWGENIPGSTQRRELKWRSMLMIPGVNVTFRACCPSGNNFVKVISNWTDTADINLSVLEYEHLKDSSGIWYESWLHWPMSFYLRLDHPVDTSDIEDCGDCYFGQCGLKNKCECADGYSGLKCEIRPGNDSYPTEKKPLVLFKEKNFQGSYLAVNSSDFQRFAYNIRGERFFDFSSMRVLFNRTVTFARNIVYTSTYTPGNDIRDITEFMEANLNVADGVWFNYDRSIDVDFYIRVESTPQCLNCSDTNGVCYTGQCVCVNYTDKENCDV